MRALMIVLTVFVFASVALAQQSPRAAIEAAGKKFAETFGKGNAAGLAAMYSEDAMLFPQNSDIVKGRAAIQAAWQGFIDSGVKGMSLTTLEVETAGNNTAIEIGTYSLTGADGKVTDKGKYLVVWKRAGNEWKLYRDIFNTSMPPLAR